ncbi:hypothetical protein M758_4G214000 [Ceratodon purpureus]|uniref:Xaa-Pro aminopeptidase P n=1 Tax=Ceratodon purpureus TaxID=3225 RepID=A0A8T0IDJ9_CERPU|nr:hypothetical protein KC19_4G211300 [Ceratodon purpureus]KAG0620416.1 hypothetical protein M758_4G214000 [Ceratodon purpureus]
MSPSHVNALELLRPLMEAHSPPLHALVVPSEDYHQSEYVADADKRREFVSGFNGSAGIALVTANEALLWTDGRYFLQATQQLSQQWKLMRIGEDSPLENWIADNLQKDGNVGVDPCCISVDTAHRWQQAFGKHGQKLISLKENLVDKVWENRPPHVVAPVCIQPLEFTGKSAKDKISDLRAKLDQEKAYAIVVTTLDEVAWLYNLRGGDVLYNPVVHAYAIVTRDSAFYYVNKAKVDLKVEQYLCENGVELRDYESVFEDIEGLASERTPAVKNVFDELSEKYNHTNGYRIDQSTAAEPVDGLEDRSNTSIEGQGGLIWIDPGTCSYAVYSRVPADRVVLQQSPLALAKALKQPEELDGMRNAHIRDGAAVISYLCWLDAQMQDLYGAAGYFSEVKGSLKRKRSEEEKLTEVTVAEKLETFRAKQEHFKGLSFETISSVGGNAAIIHYAAKEETCAEMQPDSMYLCDSGGQYLDGTTDVTRTMHFGKPTSHEKSCATLVLKGHIALDMAVFPAGTTGHALDILARVPLWKDGLDYRHGTGHGVGSYLNVHEGPHLISFRPQARNVALQANMTVTDEPGYYEDGNFGVRIENVLIVKEAQAKHNFGDKGYLAFEHITWVPYQTKLMDLSLMSEVEKDWVDDYHSVCREKVSPLLSGPELEWLHRATEPLPR